MLTQCDNVLALVARHIIASMTEHLHCRRDTGYDLSVNDPLRREILNLENQTTIIIPGWDANFVLVKAYGMNINLPIFWVLQDKRRWYFDTIRIDCPPVFRL
jgi:hypothetical protein